jgi:hypothetical protein
VGIFKLAKRPFKVVATILETLHMESHKSFFFKVLIF